MNQLHILNGDAIINHFEASKIDGHIMVCREILAEGRASKEVGSSKFIQHRKAFFILFFDEADALYQEQFLSELAKLNNADQYNEITLWFEYDLFCQINMMAMLSHLYQKGAKNVSLVCIGALEGYEGLVGLGEIDPELYPRLYTERQQLLQSDLEYADQCWESYCSADHRPMLQLAADAPLTFPYFNEALIQTHFKRFPKAKNGLNEIEETILRLIKSEKHSRSTLIGALLKWQELYGFGDWQYEMYLNNLQSLFKEGAQLELTETGEKVLAGSVNFMELSQHHYHWGGVHNRAYYYDTQKSQLNKNS